MKHLSPLSFFTLLTVILLLFASCTQTDPRSTEATAAATDTDTEQTAKIISSYEAAGQSASCYATPKPGTFFCFMEVNAAREENDHDESVRYLLHLDIFTADGEASPAEKQQEYERLQEMGIPFYECTYWTYYGENAQKEYDTATLGLFSEADLLSFTPQAEYGYAFSFLTNGDGSEIECNIQ